MNLPRPRSPSEVLKRGYSDEEVAHIYELGRFFLGNGDVRRAETIFAGLTEIVPDFAPAWLGMAYIQIHSRDYDAAPTSSRQAFKVEPEMTEALMFVICCLLTTGDYNAAGTYLGEIGEKIQSGMVDDPHVVRLYKAQLARYELRA